MSWDALAAIAEALGAVAVLASLVYLATQVRQNTQMMKSSIRQQLTATSQDVIFKGIDLASVVAKAANRETLTAAEQIQLNQLHRAALRGLEDFAYQNQHGLLDPSEWAARLESARDLMSMPQMRRNWRANRQQYSENLQKVIDPLASSEEN
jgi:hypothetical protein